MMEKVYMIHTFYKLKKYWDSESIQNWIKRKQWLAAKTFPPSGGGAMAWWQQVLAVDAKFNNHRAPAAPGFSKSILLQLVDF